jgi:hypothetical protein
MAYRRRHTDNYLHICGHIMHEKRQKRLGLRFFCRRGNDSFIPFEIAAKK